MKLGVFTTLLSNLPLEEACRYFHELGIQMVEIGCGGYPGNAHADPDTLLSDDAALAAFQATLEKYDLQISALSCHGNPVHPDKATAKMYDDDFKDAVLLAEKMGIDTVITFSGCPMPNCPRNFGSSSTCSSTSRLCWTLPTTFRTGNFTR